MQDNLNMKNNNERLASIESDIRNINSNIKDIKENFANCDKKYSKKWVENTLIAIIILSFGAFISQL